MRLGKVLKVSEVAKMAGWKRKRMLTHLQRINEELGGTLLRNTSLTKTPRWTVTLEALALVAPQWFTDDSKDDSFHARLRRAEDRIDDQGRVLKALVAKLSA
jgi:hypothetical protein